MLPTRNAMTRNLSHFYLSRANYSFSRTSPIASAWTSKHYQRQQLSQSSNLILKRTLFSDEALGMNNFRYVRELVGRKFGNFKGKFIERFREYVKNENDAIMAEDLKNLIFLCEAKKEEVDLLLQSAAKYEKQNESLKFGTFKFGPILMRMAYDLNLPDLALEMMKKENINFYTQVSTVTIALDLLLKNQRYEDVVKLYHYVSQNYPFDMKYPLDFFQVFAAACYKINTAESFDDLYKTLRLIQAENLVIKIRALSFFLALAVKQGHPNIALEVLSQANFNVTKCLPQSIKLLALAQMNRFSIVNDILRQNLKRDRATNNQKAAFKDTLDIIGANLEKTSKKDLIADFKKLTKNLDESDLIEKHRTLDEALMEPIQPKHNQEIRENKFKSRNQSQNLASTFRIERV